MDSETKVASSIEPLTNALVAAGSILLREAGRLFRSFGITAAQFNVLRLLIEAPRGLRPSDLTSSLVVDASSTTYLLDQMERRGWLRRRRDLADRRAYRVVVSPAGQKLFNQVSPLYTAALGEIGRHVPPAHAKRLTAVLERIQQLAPRAVDHVLQTPGSSRRKRSTSAPTTAE